MKIGSPIANARAAKAAEKAPKIQNVYKTVLKILTGDLNGVEFFLPGGLLKLNVSAVIGDEFDAAIKSIGNDALKVDGFTLWRSTTSRGTIYVDGINPSMIDEQWNELIDRIRFRIEF